MFANQIKYLFIVQSLKISSKAGEKFTNPNINNISFPESHWCSAGLYNANKLAKCSGLWGRALPYIGGHTWIQWKVYKPVGVDFPANQLIRRHYVIAYETNVQLSTNNGGKYLTTRPEAIKSSKTHESFFEMEWT